MKKRLIVIENIKRAAADKDFKENARIMPRGTKELLVW